MQGPVPRRRRTRGAAHPEHVTRPPLRPSGQPPFPMPRPSLRRTLAPLAAVACLAAGGCSTPTPAASTSVPRTTNDLGAVQVTGAPGATPKVSVPTPFSVPSSTRRVLARGTGAARQGGAARDGGLPRHQRHRRAPDPLVVRQQATEFRPRRQAGDARDRDLARRRPRRVPRARGARAQGRLRRPGAAGGRDRADRHDRRAPRRQGRARRAAQGHRDAGGAEARAARRPGERPPAARRSRCPRVRRRTTSSSSRSSWGGGRRCARGSSCACSTPA